MEQIKDLNGYLARMDATMVDKCWWLNQLDENDKIDTVIDYGCAGGALKEAIDSIAYGKFRYIGIDNNPDMVKLCRDKGLEVYYDMEYIIKAHLVDPEHTIVVMNSVLHEIEFYDGRECSDLLIDINDAGFKFVAIRDMALKDSIDYDLPGLTNLLQHILSSKYEPKFQQFRAECLYTRYAAYMEINICTLEFLLKYWYEENWARECGEQYLWYWEKDVEDTLIDYDIQYSKWFQIPYVVDKIKKDFDYNLPFPTHRKLLLRNRNFIL